MLRLAPGDRVRVFDGRGAEFESVVEAADKSGVRVRLGAPIASAPEPRVAVTLAQAVLKGDKMDGGRARCRDDRRGRDSTDRQRANRVVHGGARARQAARTLGAHRRVVGQAMRSRRRSSDSGTEAAARMRLSPSPVFVLVEPGAASGLSLGESEMPAAGQASVLIGPEGGWTSEELSTPPPLAGCSPSVGGRCVPTRWRSWRWPRCLPDGAST